MKLLQNGKSNCRINGQLATVALLKQIGPYLIDIHGQNEHFLLLNEEKHLGLLDEFAHHQMGDLIAEYDEAYAKVVAAKQELRALQTARKRRRTTRRYVEIPIARNRRSQYLCG